MNPNQKINCRVVAFLFVVSLFNGSKAEDYLPLYQPELENIEIEPYINNPRLFNLEAKCLIYDGPCDIVGRFLKPRMAKGLLGECILCTPKQAITVQKLLRWVQTNRPELYRLAVAKYLQNVGISLPPNELATLEHLEMQEGLNSSNTRPTTPVTPI